MSAYHGWTHAPKEDGGTDPIPAAAATLIDWAGFFKSGQALGTTYTNFEFASVSNSASGTAFSVSGGDIVLPSAGMYDVMVRFGSFAINPNKDTHFEAGMEDVGDDLRYGARAFNIGGMFETFSLRIDTDSDPTTYGLVQLDTKILVEAGVAPVALEIKGFMLEDTVAVAHSVSAWASVVGPVAAKA